MADDRTFSESWYRIASQHVALRPHVHVRRQFFRGERYYVLQDPLTNQFFRLRPAAYEFVARLNLDRTVEEVWRECMEMLPEDAPGQEDALRLLVQLHSSNLLHSDLSPDTAKVFERYHTRKRKENRSTVLNVMYAKFPLLDPDRFLKGILPLLRAVISPVGAAIWLAVVGWAIKVAIDHAGELQGRSQGLLAPGNLVLLYLATVLIKLTHEFGHAASCRRFGGEVHTTGVMLMLFTPMPFVDTTASWSFRSRWPRAFVGAAGMIFELFLASLALFVWANTGEGALNSLAYNMMFVASVSTVLFNINPLLRFDGYYILSDLLEIPNLQSRATMQITHLAEHYGFGLEESHSPATSRKEAFWLSAYGLLSLAYRVLLFSGILLFIADRFFGLGILIALVCSFTWLIMPMLRLGGYLFTSPRLLRHRSRAVGICGAIVVLLVVGLQLLPAPNHFRAPGILEAEENSLVSSEIDGELVRVLAPGNEVVPGQTLVELRNTELVLEAIAARGELAEAQAQRQRALGESVADLETIDSRIETVQKRVERLQQQEKALIVKATHPGLWVAPDLPMRRGSWVSRGTELGRLVNPAAFHFSAVVSEGDASRLFAGEIRGAQVKLAGQSEITLPVSSQKIIPAEQKTLPSAALGWRAGGEVALSSGDRAGVQAREPFFALHADIVPAEGAVLLQGRSGTIRFDLPSEPLLSQWVRKFRQLVQRRYGV